MSAALLSSCPVIHDVAGRPIAVKPPNLESAAPWRRSWPPSDVFAAVFGPASKEWFTET